VKKIIVWLVLIGGGGLWASSGGNFLTFPTGARSLSLAEGGIISSDVEGLYYNCGVLASLTQMGFSFSHESHFLDITNDYFAFGAPIDDRRALGVNLGIFRAGSVSGYDSSGNPTKDYEEKDLAFGLYYSQYLLGGSQQPLRLSAGVGIKIINSVLGEDSASSFGIDGGFLYSFLVADRPLSLGLSVSNAGGSLSYYQEAAALPMTIRAGVGYNFDFLGNPVNASLSYNLPGGLSGYPGVGLEYILKEILSIRLGYVVGDEKVGVSGIKFGLGIKILGINFDYANSPHPVLGDNHLFSMGINFGPQMAISAQAPVSAETIFNRALKLYNDGRYAESIIEFNKVLELDPTNNQALDYMKKASEKIKK